MNGKPNVEPPWMSLKRLIETRMVEILRKEQGNRKYIRLYGAENIGTPSKSRPVS